MKLLVNHTVQHYKNPTLQQMAVRRWSQRWLIYINRAATTFPINCSCVIIKITNHDGNWSNICYVALGQKLITKNLQILINRLPVVKCLSTMITNFICIKLVISCRNISEHSNCCIRVFSFGKILYYRDRRRGMYASALCIRNHELYWPKISPQNQPQNSFIVSHKISHRFWLLTACT